MAPPLTSGFDVRFAPRRPPLTELVEVGCLLGANGRLGPEGTPGGLVVTVMKVTTPTVTTRRLLQSYN